MRVMSIVFFLLLLVAVEGFVTRNGPRDSHNGQCLLRQQESIHNPRFRDHYNHYNFSLHAAAAKKRYGFQVRQAKRQASRRKRKQRATRADQEKTVEYSTNDSSTREDTKTTTSSSSSENKVVRVFKWPFRKIRNVFSKSIFDLVEQ